MRAFLSRIWRWLLVIVAIAVPWLWALAERRARRAAVARAEHAEGAIERDRVLVDDLQAIERRANGARVEVAVSTERDAGPHDAAATIAAAQSAEVRAHPDPSTELLEEIARRNQSRIEAIRRASEEPSPW